MSREESFLGMSREGPKREGCEKNHSTLRQASVQSTFIQGYLKQEIRFIPSLLLRKLVRQNFAMALNSPVPWIILAFMRISLKLLRIPGGSDL